MTTALKNALSAGRDKTPYEKFRDRLFQLKPELVPLVGADKIDRFVRVALNAVQANGDLLSCDSRSLLNSCMRAATDGLLPDSREAVFNVYNTKVKTAEGEKWVRLVQYLPMVGGLIKKLYDSGFITFVDAVAVYQRDTFIYQRGDEPKIEHVPYGGGESPGPIVAAYAIIKLKSGEIKREVMWKRDLDKVKGAAKTDKVWDAWEDQMAIKSVIKRAYKQLPSSIEIDSIIASDNAAMGFTGQDINLAPALPEHAGGEPVPTGAAATGNAAADANAGRVESETVAEQEVDHQDEALKRDVEHADTGAGVDKATGEISVTADKVIEKISNAKDIELLDADADLINYIPGINDEDSGHLEKMYHDKRAELEKAAGAKKGKAK